MDNYQKSLDAVFRALADPTRRAIIQQLGNGPASISELASPFEMALPSFIKHITILEDCGIITTKKTGRVRTCKIRNDEISHAESWIREQREQWDDRLRRLATRIEQEEPEYT